jgi:hypothetical protein
MEVRTTGSDNNGGGFDSGVSSPGTDYSQQDSAQVAYTDIVIGGAGNTNQLTSAANPFSSTSPGNFINITGGTGFTTGLYLVVSVSGSTATMDRTVGTASSTGGTGNLGGAFATVGKAMGNMTVGGQVTYVKGGTYQILTNLPNSVTANTGSTLSRIVGYSSTRGDNGQATIQLNANNITMFYGSVGGSDSYTNGISVENLIFDGNNKTGSNGANLGGQSGSVGLTSFSNCIFKNFTGQYCIQIFLGALNVQNCEFANNAFTSLHSGCIFGPAANGTGGPPLGSQSANVSDSYFTGNSISSTNQAATVWAENLALSMQNCIVYNNTGTNHDGILIKNPLSVNVSNCAFHSNSRHGIFIDSTVSCALTNIQNNIITSNGGWGINGVYYSDGGVTQVSPTIVTINHNAYYNNTSGDKTGLTAGASEVTLTGLPYVNAPTDFSLNSTAGQGAACRAAATPGTLGVSSVVGTGYLDIGPLQHGASASSAYTFLA